LCILAFNSSGIEFKNSFLNFVKKFDIALSGELAFVTCAICSTAVIFIVTPFLFA
jgi:hypothetical protein